MEPKAIVLIKRCPACGNGTHRLEITAVAMITQQDRESWFTRLFYSCPDTNKDVSIEYRHA